MEPARLPTLDELVRTVYGGSIERDLDRIWLKLPESAEPLEEEELVRVGHYGRTIYRVRLYVATREAYLVVPFADVITPEEWPLLEEEPDAPARPDPEL